MLNLTNRCNVFDYDILSAFILRKIKEKTRGGKEEDATSIEEGS